MEWEKVRDNIKVLNLLNTDHQIWTFSELLSLIFDAHLKSLIYNFLDLDRLRCGITFRLSHILLQICTNLFHFTK